MGVDWFRMRPRPGASMDELQRLVESQSQAAQASSWFLSRDLLIPQVAADIQQRLSEQFVESSRKLRDLLDFPTCDRSTGFPDDDQNLVPSMRVYPIAYTSVFPIRWRVDAYRSYLPGTLHDQIQTWKDWLVKIECGKHQSYLSELYLNQISFQLVECHQELTKLADASLTQHANWTSKPEFIEVRDSIPSLQCPSIHVPSDNISNSSGEHLHESAEFRELFSQAERLSEANKAWNRTTRGNWKVTNCKLPTFQEFLNQAKAPWLQEFFNWAQACCDRGMGLFLDP